MTWVIIITLLLGISAGIWLGELLRHKKAVGTLRIDKSDPDGPYLFLELKCDPYCIEKLSSVILDVSVSNYISRT